MKVNVLRVHRVAAIAEKRGVSMAQVALAWSLSKPFVTAPIVGTTSIDKLKDLVGTSRYVDPFEAPLTYFIGSRRSPQIDEGGNRVD